MILTWPSKTVGYAFIISFSVGVWAAALTTLMSTVGDAVSLVVVATTGAGFG